LRLYSKETLKKLEYERFKENSVKGDYLLRLKNVSRHVLITNTTKYNKYLSERKIIRRKFISLV